MALNECIQVLCGRCDGTGRKWTIGGTEATYDRCGVCDGTGRDREAEARLAELADRLLGHAVLVQPDWPLLSRDLDTICALLSAGDGAAGQG